MDSINIEIILKNGSKVSAKEIKSAVERYLINNRVRPNAIISRFDKDENKLLYDDVEHIIVGDFEADLQDFNLTNLKTECYIYNLDKFGPKVETDDDGNGGEVNLATHWTLPSSELYNLWENLYYDDNIKEKLLKYATTIMEFSDRGVNGNIISCNRVILLHGPPGTGKTSLCKALAQKLTVRLQERYNKGILVEINSHSLFSKWFSESGKLVTKMFLQIKEILEDNKLLVCLLIDEVESLAHARNQCMSGNEPSDSIRVVNAVLTEIDQIKRYPNVLILTTSNITEAIDLAFVDRADIKQFLGCPTVQAIYKIYHSCIEELLKTGLLFSSSVLHPVNAFKNLKYIITEDDEDCRQTRRLIELCELSDGMSGRSLRKIPFLTHALFLKRKGSYSTAEFLDAMEKAVELVKAERKHFMGKV